MTIMTSGSTAASSSAAVLEPGGFYPRARESAMNVVTAALSHPKSSSAPIYAVLLYGKPGTGKTHNYLTAVRTFFKAYRRGLETLSAHSGAFLTHFDLDHASSLKTINFGDVSFFWGRASAKEVQQRVDLRPGIYIFPSHLDHKLLMELDLPSLLEPFAELPALVQVNYPEWGDLKMGSSHVLKVPHHGRSESFANKNTLAWRKQFISENPCFTSDEIAQEATSRATNRAAMASRWVQEKKIFSVRFEGQQLFPQFQFQDGRPIPAVSKVIKTFPEIATGWDLAYFFLSPNPNIGGSKPVDLLKRDPARLASLTQAYIHPADVF
jgi:hypothetical protein